MKGCLQFIGVNLAIMGGGFLLAMVSQIQLTVGHVIVGVVFAFAGWTAWHETHKYDKD